MLNPDALKAYHQLLTVEINEVNHTVQRNVQLRLSECIKAGVLQSGRAMVLVADEYAKSIPQRVKIAVTLLMRSLEAHGISVNNGNKQDILYWLHQFIDNTEQQLCGLAMNTAPFRSLIAPAEAALRQIRLNSHMEKERVTGEISLMAARKVNVPLDETANTILATLRDEFIASNRPSSELHNGYAGPKLAELESAILSNPDVSKVDYDLSLKSLEDRIFVKTGPVKPYDNPPNTRLFVMAMVSQREYIYLTEDGYRASKTAKKKSPSYRPTSPTTVNISGGSFNNSPIGVGAHVKQTLNIDVGDENQTVSYLTELLSKNGNKIDASATSEIRQMVQAAGAGNMAAATPIFQKLFGATGDAIKGIAYGVLSAIIAHQLGMG